MRKSSHPSKSFSSLYLLAIIDANRIQRDKAIKCDTITKYIAERSVARMEMFIRLATIFYPLKEVISLTEFYYCSHYKIVSLSFYHSQLAFCSSI